MKPHFQTADKANSPVPQKWGGPPPSTTPPSPSQALSPPSPTTPFSPTPLTLSSGRAVSESSTSEVKRTSSHRRFGGQKTVTTTLKAIDKSNGFAVWRPRGGLTWPGGISGVQATPIV